MSGLAYTVQARKASGVLGPPSAPAQRVDVYQVYARDRSGQLSEIATEVVVPSANAAPIRRFRPKPGKENVAGSFTVGRRGETFRWAAGETIALSDPETIRLLLRYGVHEEIL